MLRSLLCDEQNQFLVVDDADAISDIIARKDRHLWLDLEKPTDQEFQLVKQEFNLHPLAVEDAMMHHQRPKVEQYVNFYFVVCYAVSAVEMTEPMGVGTPEAMVAGRR